MTTAEITTSGLSGTEHNRQMRRALIASTVGTTIEWYDFLLYGQVTGLVFGKLFFPQSDPLVGGRGMRPGSLVRTRLPAGGNRIRTRGPMSGGEPARTNEL